MLVRTFEYSAMKDSFLHVLSSQYKSYENRFLQPVFPDSNFFEFATLEFCYQKLLVIHFSQYKRKQLNTMSLHTKSIIRILIVLLLFCGLLTVKYNIMHKTLRYKWLNQRCCSASEFVPAEREEACNPQRFKLATEINIFEQKNRPTFGKHL